MTKMMTFGKVDAYVSIDHETLGEFRDSLELWIEEYGPNARFEFENDYDGDKGITIKVEREETDEEYQRRLRNERDWAAYREKRDREDYERLVKKYGKEGPKDD